MNWLKVHQRTAWICELTLLLSVLLEEHEEVLRAQLALGD